jgi:hypothetical protein
VREADNLHPYSADVKKSRSLNSPRPLWACMACNGCALAFFIIAHQGGLRCGSAVTLLLGFESHRPRECLSLVSVVCCQVEVSASG